MSLKDCKVIYSHDNIKPQTGFTSIHFAYFASLEFDSRLFVTKYMLNLISGQTKPYSNLSVLVGPDQTVQLDQSQTRLVHDHVFSLTTELFTSYDWLYWWAFLSH